MTKHQHLWQLYDGTLYCMGCETYHEIYNAIEIVKKYKPVEPPPSDNVANLLRQYYKARRKEKKW